MHQSSETEVCNNVERRRLQYDLVNYARELGFAEVEPIDDDRGVSGSGAQGPGFERLQIAVSKGRVALVLSPEASRLARNGRDRHTLPDFRAVVECPVGDRQRLYDPGRIDDRSYPA